MLHTPLIAGGLIQAGLCMIEAGLKRVIPEVAKLLDEPEIEQAAKDLDIGNSPVAKILVGSTYPPN